MDRKQKPVSLFYDHPYGGSKRTGPDLLREGGKYNDSWFVI
jgi:cytochrome c oxidase cbb3-type subunit I/II